MKIVTAIVLGVLAGSSGLASTAQAAQPMKGTYYVSDTEPSIQNRSGSGCSSLAHAAANTLYNIQHLGYFYYPGPLKSGATTTLLSDGATNYSLGQFGGTGAGLPIIGWPLTPAAGQTSWSGQLTYSFMVDGTPLPSYPVSFSVAFTFLSPRSFITRGTWVWSTPNGTCTENHEAFYIRTGN